MSNKFDFLNPDYHAIFAKRLERLNLLRSDPILLQDVRAHYKENPADFINDWGTTSDPRLVSRGLPAVVPFLLFDRQREMIEYITRKWKAGEAGLIEKSRDVGASWLTMAYACTVCLHNTGVVIGFGSRKEEYVDLKGSPKSLFWKGREFIKRLPREFRGTWTEADAPFLRIGFPDTESFIAGEAGDGIGRGDRCSLYFVDEAAHLERPELVDYSLSATTDCRIDMSSVNGMRNPFAEKRHSGRIEVFVFHWRSDPRKDDAWYAKKCLELPPVVVAQELDLDYSASVEGVLIPSEWARACIDSHVRLKITPTGAKVAALDVADAGIDSNALCGTHGILVETLEQWSGKGADIFATTQKAFAICDKKGYPGFTYDGDGLGAGVRGDSRVINEGRSVKLHIKAFRGSASVDYPNNEDIRGLKNIDAFANKKAQGAWALRARVERTYRWVVEGKECDPDEILSISSSLKNYRDLINEMSQPTYKTNGVGKIVIDKAPDGQKSPNLFDALMIRFGSATHRPMIITGGALNRFKNR
jgi:phage terminase large subunit